MTDEFNLLDNLDIFLGATSPAVARVYARVSGVPDAAGLRLSGQLYGPRCAFSKTLPARIPFRDVGPPEAGGPLLAQAVLPDPCFWSTDLPTIYRATIEVRRGNTVVARAERDYGTQAIGVHGRALRCCGKRWVLRAVDCESVTSNPPLSDWREAFAAMAISHPDDAVCAAASEQGVFIVARLDSAAIDPVVELRRLARFAAVGIAIINVPLATERAAALRATAADILLAQPFASEPASCKQIAVCNAADPVAFSKLAARVDRPIFAVRRLATPLELPAARAACDQLQGDLVRDGDFAGYGV